MSDVEHFTQKAISELKRLKSDWRQGDFGEATIQIRNILDHADGTRRVRAADAYDTLDEARDMREGPDQHEKIEEAIRSLRSIQEDSQ